MELAAGVHGSFHVAPAGVVLQPNSTEVLHVTLQAGSKAATFDEQLVLAANSLQHQLPVQLAGTVCLPQLQVTTLDGQLLAASSPPAMLPGVLQPGEQGQLQLLMHNAGEVPVTGITMHAISGALFFDLPSDSLAIGETRRFSVCITAQSISVLDEPQVVEQPRLVEVRMGPGVQPLQFSIACKAGMPVLRVLHKELLFQATSAQALKQLHDSGLAGIPGDILVRNAGSLPLELSLGTASAGKEQYGVECASEALPVLQPQCESTNLSFVVPWQDVARMLDGKHSGEKRFALQLRTNARGPAAQLATLSCALRVVQPDVNISRPLLDLGECAPGKSTKTTLTVTNSGRSSDPAQVAFKLTSHPACSFTFRTADRGKHDLVPSSAGAKPLLLPTNSGKDVCLTLSVEPDATTPQVAKAELVATVTNQFDLKHGTGCSVKYIHLCTCAVPGGSPCTMNAFQ